MLGGGSFFYGLGGFDFSYAEVKRAVVIGLIGFFLFIASAALGFLYLKQITHDYKKKEKKQEKKRRRGRTRTFSPPPPAIEISTPREILVTLPYPPLFPHHGYCLVVDVKPSSLLS